MDPRLLAFLVAFGGLAAYKEEEKAGQQGHIGLSVCARMRKPSGFGNEPFYALSCGPTPPPFLYYSFVKELLLQSVHIPHTVCVVTLLISWLQNPNDTVVQHFVCFLGRLLAAGSCDVMHVFSLHTPTLRGCVTIRAHLFRS